MDLIVGSHPVFAFTFSRDFNSAKPTILFVHGAGMDHSIWALQGRYFAHHNTNAVAVDLPGHGRSGGAPLPSIDALADWLASVISELGVERAKLVGHSMGALVCLEAARRHPALIDGVALLGVASAMPVHPALLEAAKANKPLAAELVASWGHGTAGHLGGNQAPGGWLMGHALKLLERAPADVLHNDLAACNAYQGGEEASAAVQCRTLIITGDQDRMTPAKQAAKMAKVMPDAHLVTIKGSGHLMMVERPDATLDALIEALH